MFVTVYYLVESTAVSFPSVVEIEEHIVRHYTVWYLPLERVLTAGYDLKCNTTGHFLVVLTTHRYILFGQRK